MAASVTMSVRKCLRSVVTFSKQLRQSEYCYAHPNTIMRRISSGQSYSRFPRLLRARSVKGVVGAVSVTAGVAGCVTLAVGHSKVVQADSGKRPTRAKYPVARKIESPTDNTGLKLTLYQYQTCPFCCKLRAYLDYRGFNYDVIEVNSVRRTQVKWSSYKKVPILVVEGQGQEGFLQINDSSVITSILESYLVDRSQTLEQLLSFYPVLESKGSRGKTIYEFPNKYYIMYGENKPDRVSADMKEEREWRRWTDDILVHTLSPNVYRTPSEAMQAFKYFSDVGDWENQFSFFERNVVIYIGAVAMYFIGKMLCRKYSLKDDVRESLYDACTEWTKAVGVKRNFLGGTEPNLADLSVYGMLSSIEGCDAFQDLLLNTNIKGWYYKTKHVVAQRQGSSAMSSA